MKQVMRLYVDINYVLRHEPLQWFMAKGWNKNKQILHVKNNLYLFSNGFSFECYSRFDQSRSHQTLVQMMASYFVMIINSTLAQYSEGVKKFGVTLHIHTDSFGLIAMDIFLMSLHGSFSLVR